MDPVIVSTLPLPGSLEDNCGIIAERELRELLREFDWEPKTVQDQQASPSASGQLHRNCQSIYRTTAGKKSTQGHQSGLGQSLWPPVCSGTMNEQKLYEL
jgi:hypothetical protein